MKNFSKVILLVGAFFMFASTATKAQDAVRNNTPCEFDVKVAYGDVAGCDVVGFDIITVPPFTQVNFSSTGGMEILYGKGRPSSTSGTTCAFYVAQGGCAPYPLSDAVSCSTGCDDYTATLIPGFGIYITQ